MTKEEYQEALKSSMWISKATTIKKRDNHRCVKCCCKDSLEVHHKYYLKDRMPWQVPDNCLVTLCRKCHQKEHEGKTISSFFRQKPPKEKIVKNIEIKEKKKKLQLYKFIAIYSKTIQQVYSKLFCIKKLTKLSKSVGGLIKGFENERDAITWVKNKIQANKIKIKAEKRKEFLESQQIK